MDTNDRSQPADARAGLASSLVAAATSRADRARLDRIGRKWTQIADLRKRGLVTVFCPPPTSTVITAHALKQLTISAGQRVAGMRCRHRARFCHLCPFCPRLRTPSRLYNLRR
jgi:hypothetical protein